VHLGKLYLPLVYIAAIVFFSESLIPGSAAIFPDAVRACIKLAVICVFSIPLVYIANLKTGIIADIAAFLRSGIFEERKFQA